MRAKKLEWVDVTADCASRNFSLMLRAGIFDIAQWSHRSDYVVACNYSVVETEIQSLDRAKEIAQEHADWLVSELVEMPTIKWQTGEIPKPIGTCALVLECGDGNHLYYAANPYGRKGKWVYDWYASASRWSPKNRIKHDDCTGRWYIQELTLPKQ